MYRKGCEYKINYIAFGTLPMHCQATQRPYKIGMLPLKTKIPKRLLDLISLVTFDLYI